MTDAVTIVVDVDEQPAGFVAVPVCSQNTCVVRLVNLDAPRRVTDATLGKQRLIDLCLGKRVDLLVSPYQETAGVLNALVDTEVLGLNEAQLAGGFARYRDMGPYAVDWYVACKLERAEKRAREARLGVWRTD